MAPSYPNSAEVHVMRYKIPEGLSCSARTLQWYWASANSCVYDGDYFDYYQGIAQQGDVCCLVARAIGCRMGCECLAYLHLRALGELREQLPLSRVD